MRNAKKYRVVSGSSCLNYYGSRKEAESYARDAAAYSGQPMSVEVYCDESGEYVAA